MEYISNLRDWQALANDTRILKRQWRDIFKAETLNENVKQKISKIRRKLNLVQMARRRYYLAMLQAERKMNRECTRCNLKELYCMTGSSVIASDLDIVSIGLAIAVPEAAIVTWSVSLANNALTCMICSPKQSVPAKWTSGLIAVDMTATTLLKNAPEGIGVGVSASIGILELVIDFNAVE